MSKVWLIIRHSSYFNQIDHWYSYKRPLDPCEQNTLRAAVCMPTHVIHVFYR